ncbi:hypothetical protein BGZ61DRAFT_490291 [Ilyonectria robusta]|uniref:uncharacterized protein n=1 Tax=Ilyonectria robusta TaxID=1079257 RepID=UPI001E8CB2F7|nr:uncharacterized protein BGZ61DRAFT_490291 [Ilyonectria robusta]KAH8734268.1 hypothetical protein BGZ61DRAFT_490291 [Ilyonectria robusta]
MTGFLIPDDYKYNKPSIDDMNIASIAWGFSLGVCIFTGAKGMRQTVKSWKRGRRTNIYLIMLWTEWASSTIMSAITWFYLRGHIPPSFAIFFVIVFLWAVQIQTLMQIIINRISILMVVRQNAWKLKLGIFLILLAINVSVFCIWVPARLQISNTFIRVNNIWDRIEKCIFLIIDASLNLYFIHLVKSRLIANGLTKYTRLFNVNLGMIGISITMDVLLVGMMSLPNDIVYLQFHPLAYLVKLHIEMNMADLITKVVKASNPADYAGYSNSLSRSNPKSSQNGATNGSKKMASMFTRGNRTYIETGGDDIELTAAEGAGGIKKTITSQVVIKPARQSEYEEQDLASVSSSTRQLHEVRQAV